MKKKKLKKKIIKRFKKYVVREKQIPKSLKHLLKEKDSFKTFESIAKSPTNVLEEISKSYVIDALHIIKEDENYANMSVREKLLSFYFVFIQEIRRDEEFLKVIFCPKQVQLMKHVKNSMRPPFVEFIDEMIQEGIMNEEIKSRTALDKIYSMTLEKDLLLVLKFWLKDHSEDKIKTDELIERLVHLEMNALGPNFLDDLFGIGKMMFENSPLSKYMKR